MHVLASVEDVFKSYGRIATLNVRVALPRPPKETEVFARLVLLWLLRS